MASMTDSDARAEYIAGLRGLADVLERDPDLALPEAHAFVWYLFFSELTADEQKSRAADLIRRLPGSFGTRETGELSRFYGTIRGAKTEIIVERSALVEATS